MNPYFLTRKCVTCLIFCSASSWLHFLVVYGFKALAASRRLEAATWQLPCRHNVFRHFMCDIVPEYWWALVGFSGLIELSTMESLTQFFPLQIWTRSFSKIVCYFVPNLFVGKRFEAIYGCSWGLIMIVTCHGLWGDESLLR